MSSGSSVTTSVVVVVDGGLVVGAGGLVVSAGGLVVAVATDVDGASTRSET